MGETSAIGWTDATFNGWIGCTEIGPGCVPCYARELDRKYQYGIKPPFRVPGMAAEAPHWGDGRPRHRTSVSYWQQPLKWNYAAQAAGRPLKVFAHSLSDVFDNEVHESWRADLFDLWRRTPWLRWIVVTKRVPNILKMLPNDWGPRGFPNVGLVATTVNQQEFDRDGPRLLSIPARWHGFSIEPQLGAITIRGRYMPEHRGSLWFILGGESAQGSAANPMIDKDTGEPRVPVSWDPRWAAEMIAACAMNVEGGFIYVKQTGAAPIGMPAPRDGMGKDPAEWPQRIRVQDFPPELLA